MREGQIDGETCPREVGQRTLKRTSEWERIMGARGVIDGETCPRGGGGSMAMGSARG